MASQPPVLTDDDIMRVRAQSAPPQQAPQPYTVGRPDPSRIAADRREEQRLRLAQEAEARQRERDAREAATTPYMPGPDGSLVARPGGPADPNRPQPTTGSARMRQLPNQQIQRLTDGATSLANLERALNSFQDNYGGNLFGGIENTLQGVNSRIGTPGQNQFWSDVAATDNVARNALFGASLTDGERQAWQATTISPSMDPAIIRQNLTRRIEIARNALGRLARTNAANGYNRDAIEASLDQYSDLLRQGTAEGGADQVSNSALQVGMAGGATGEGDPNFAQHLQGTGAGTPERFRMLESYHQWRHDNNGIYVGVYDENGQPTELQDLWGVTPEQTQQLEQEYQRELPNQQARQRREQFATEHPVLAGADTFVRSAANAMTLGLADRIAGGMNGTGAETEHAITQSDWENRPITALGGTLAGGMVLPVGRTLPRQIGAGAAYGGAYGYNATDGSPGDRAQNALIGAVGGAGMSAIIGGGMRLAGRGGRNALQDGIEPPPGGTPPPSNVELVQAANRQGVDLMPADLGNPTIARMTGGMRQTIGGAGPVARGAQRTEQQVGRRLSALASREGAPAEREVLGDQIRASMEGYNARSGEYGRNLYANASDLAEGVPLQGRRASEVLNRNLQELSGTSNTDAPLISGLERLQADIAPGGNLRTLTVDQMRRLRTTVRSEAQTEGLRATDYQRRANEVLDALSEDIAGQLPPAASREFHAADQAWARRLDFIDDVEHSILGSKNDRSAEAVARRLIGMTRGDSARLVRVLDTVSAEESRMIRGSAINELGRATDGSPNAGGFSLETFLTNYNALPQRTRGILFRGQSRADVEDLISIAQARRVANRSGNFSGTGGAVNTSNLVHNASLLSAWGTTGISLLAENLTGRMLASPRLVRFLARPPRDPGKLARGLRRIAVAEPAIGGNIDRIIQGLQRTANDNAAAVTRSAAGTNTQRDQ